MASRPASTPLWGQLLRKHTLAVPSTESPLPPTAPLDRTGTSMRILLHDTQANFEKFSNKVDSLTEGIDETKREMRTVRDLFQKEHESLTMDFVDLVNRSQTQVQKSVGEPAQATSLEFFRKDVEIRLEGLTKRLDDMQSVNQNQSQTLQNVSQALLNLQDQQSKILASLLPLLPLLQAVPVHINSARSSITETVLKVSLDSNRAHATPPHLWTQVLNKRSAHPSSPFEPRKRQKLDPVTPTRIHSRRQTNTGHRTPLLAIHRDPTAPRRPLGDLPIPAPQDESEVVHSIRKDPSPPLARQHSLLESAMRAEEKNPSTPSRPETPASAPPSSPSPMPPSAPLNLVLPTTDNKPETNIAPLTVRNVAVMQQQVAPMAVKATMVRGRRSPFRDGRRFIPLDDDDDSDSEE